MSQVSAKAAPMQSQMTASADALEQLMQTDTKIVVMTADLVSSCKLSNIEHRFPERFINVGIAEQNMVSIAAGLAKEGMKPFVHTFSVFASLRACEQIRTDVFYNDMNVKIVGTHGGMSTGAAGPTHYSLEDIGVVSAMPGSVVIVPADGPSTAAFIRKLAVTEGPAYIRLDRNPLANLYVEDCEMAVGVGNVLAQGKGIVVIAIGAAVSEALLARRCLMETTGITITVVDMPTIKPFDQALLQQLSQQHSRCITVEEHNLYGGLGSAVGLTIAQLGLNMRLKCLAIPDCYPRGNPPSRNRELYGLDCKGIIKAVEEVANISNFGLSYDSQKI